MKFIHKLARLGELSLALNKTLFLVWLFNSTAALAEAAVSSSLMGQAPPEWHFTNWINSPALELRELRGSVVLVRWWTAPGCPYCAATAPALNEFDARFRERGLRVIGAYHEKSDGPVTLEVVKRYAKKY